MNRTIQILAFLVGLYLNSVSLLAQAERVTFTKQVAPILYSQCAPCHRPGQAAPFSLLTYEDARPRARQIADVTRARQMPPWKPEAG